MSANSERIYRTTDKSAWGAGPWQDEPDKIQWTDEATGLPCLIVRGPIGALCGCVGIAEGHPLFNKTYDENRVGKCGDTCGEDYHYACTPEAMLEVHGGITYTNFCQKGVHESEGVCHVPDAGQPDHVWWFGFDCVHYQDIVPKFQKIGSGTHGEVYRDVAFVKSEVTKLAAQLHAMERGR